MSLEQFWTISEFLFKYTKNQPIVDVIFVTRSFQIHQELIIIKNPCTEERKTLNVICVIKFTLIGLH